MLQLAGGHDQIAGTFCRFPKDHGQRIGFILNCILLYIWYLIMCSDTSDETKITSTISKGMTFQTDKGDNNAIADLVNLNTD